MLTKRNFLIGKKQLIAYQKSIRKLAKKYNAAVFDIQPLLDKMPLGPTIEKYFYNGFDPNAAGHQLIADEWMRAVTRKYGEINKLLQ